jgi:hypothetical protein
MKGTPMVWILCWKVREKKNEVVVDLNTQICHVIPVVVPGLPHFGPPIPQGLIPDDVRPEDLQHLQTLAAIDQLAVDLPGQLSADIHRTVAANMRLLGEKLGGGIELSRYDTTSS